MKKAFKQGYKEDALQKTLFEMEPEPEKERCAGCGKVLAEKDITYSLIKNGQKEPKKYCQPCAKKILRPNEEIFSSL